MAQAQRTVQRSIENIQTKTETKDGEDKLTGEQLFLYKPRAFLVIGSLSEFIDENGINEMKYSSFELFRRSIDSPEIITYDELYERACFIVQNAEKEDPESQSRYPQEAEMEINTEEDVLPHKEKEARY